MLEWLLTVILFCNPRFLSDEKRETHEQLIHYGNSTGARIVCDICGKGFLQVSHLQKHIEAHHSDNPDKKAKGENKSEMCTICGLWLSSRYRLKLHRKCHTMEPNRCQECGLEAPNHDALLGHIRAFHEVRRKHKCRLCNQSFTSARELQVSGASYSIMYKLKLISNSLDYSNMEQPTPRRNCTIAIIAQKHSYGGLRSTRTWRKPTHFSGTTKKLPNKKWHWR